MKKILIAGADSYIGTSFERWLKEGETSDDYLVNTLDMKDENWKKHDFSSYDAILHVAGIAHQKETRGNAHLYYKVNRDLAIATAQKAKREEVGQFILLSTMNVYGKLEGIITTETIPQPTSHYGKAKLQADKAIQKMESPEFKVAIIRPPMVYGKGCKGNYNQLSRFAKISPIFPYTDTRRSMIHVDNLCSFIQGIIDEEKQGMFFPQNAEYVDVSDMVKRIADIAGHRIHIIKGIGWSLKMLGGSTAKKVLGTLVYDMKNDRCLTITYEESIKRTEC